MEAIIKKLKEQWKQPSTLQGITVLTGLVGYTLSPESLELIIMGGTVVFGVISLLMSEGDVVTKVDTTEK